MLGRFGFRLKMVLFPVVASIGFVLILAIAPVMLREQEDHLSRIHTSFLPALEASRDVSQLLTDIQRNLKDAADAEDAAKLQETDPLVERFLSRLNDLSRLAVHANEQDAQLAGDMRRYYALARETTQQMIAGQLNDDVLANAAKMTTELNAIRAALDGGIARDRAKMNQAFEAALSVQRKSRSVFTTIMIITACALVALVLLAFNLTRNVMRQLSVLMLGFERMANGDFSQPIAVVSADELGELGNRANAMIERLGELLRRVASTSDVVAAAAASMFSAVREQEASATQQNVALEEVRHTIAKLAEAAQQVARDATQVKELAASSLTSSQRIADHTKLVSAHSERIGQILQLIQDIADKSDLLALNAALEGTKAGEVGRGFSLVAAEMRRLSEHVMDSVRDIRKLVADTREAAHASVLATEEGIKLAREAAGSAAKISDAAVRQQGGTDEVRTAADEIVRVLNESLAGSGETTRSAETLMQLSQETKTAAQTFRFTKAQ
jgi:methyl-accepting chemotaxis protein